MITRMLLRRFHAITTMHSSAAILKLKPTERERAGSENSEKAWTEFAKP